MTWSDPEAGKTYFETDDVPTQGNIATYLFDNLLALQHPVGSREYAEKGVANSTTETSLFTAAPLIAAGSLGATGTFHAFLFGRVRQGTTGAMLWTWRVKLGGTTVLTVATNGGGAVAAEGNWWAHISVENQASQTSQRVIVIADTTATYAQVFGSGVATAAAAVNTATDLTFDVTVQMGTAGANDYAYKMFSKQVLARN